MNFLEGTRFSSAIQTKQQSPYQYLLKPKAGGIALALSVLSDKFHSLLDITIVYPDGVPTFWQFLCGQVKRITVRIEQTELPPKFLQTNRCSKKWSHSFIRGLKKRLNGKSKSWHIAGNPLQLLKLGATTLAEKGSSNTDSNK